MKIAYLTNQYPKVSHSFIRREILALEKIGFEVIRVSIRGWDIDLVDPVDINERQKTLYLLESGVLGLIYPALQMLLSGPIKFFKALLKSFKLGIRADKSLLHHFMYFLEACKLSVNLRNDGVEHLHVHFGTNPTELGLLSGIMTSIPFSFTVHGPEEFDKPEFIKLSQKVEASAFVVAISSYCKSQIYRVIPHSQWSKVKVVHCGLDKDFFETSPIHPPIENRLVCVGRICEQKGQLLLVDAVAELNQKGIDFQLVLAGDGEMRGEVEEKIASYELGDKISITGWLSTEEVIRELLNSKALVLPSFAEGLPVVIMEAMALKRPVLSTYIAAIPELVVNIEHGFLFPAGSKEHLVNAIEKILALSPSDLELMGESCHYAVKNNHSIESEVLKLKDLFQLHYQH